MLDIKNYWRLKGPEIVRALMALRPNTGNLDALIDQVLKAHTADLKPLLLEHLAKSYSTKLTVLHSDLPKTFRVSGTLSATINKHLNFPEIRRDIRIGLKSSKAVYKIAQELRDNGYSVAKLPKYLKDITDNARTVARLSHDNRDFLKFQQKLKQAQTKINKLVDPSTSTLRRAYQDVLDQSTTYSEQSYNKAVQYAVKVKQKYQTERLVRNETTRVYTAAAQADLKADTDAIGWRWVLAGDRACEICMDKSTANDFGLGPGGYPKRISIGIPAHPSCICNVEKIYR